MDQDWIDPWVQARLLPERWNVAGFALPRMSIWHVFVLEQLRNAYMFRNLDINPSMDDAASLLLFCCRDAARGKDLWWNTGARSRAVAKLFKKLRRKPWEDVHDAVKEYVETNTRTVSRWKKKGSEGKPCAVPAAYHIVVMLGRTFGIDPDETWDYPYSLARAYFDAAAERDGDDSILSPQAQRMEDEWHITHPENN